MTTIDSLPTPDSLPTQNSLQETLPKTLSEFHQIIIKRKQLLQSILNTLNNYPYTLYADATGTLPDLTLFLTKPTCFVFNDITNTLVSLTRFMQSPSNAPFFIQHLNLINSSLSTLIQTYFSPITTPISSISEPHAIHQCATFFFKTILPFSISEQKTFPILNTPISSALSIIKNAMFRFQIDNIPLKQFLSYWDTNTTIFTTEIHPPFPTNLKGTLISIDPISYTYTTIKGSSPSLTPTIRIF